MIVKKLEPFLINSGHYLLKKIIILWDHCLHFSSLISHFIQGLCTFRQTGAFLSINNSATILVRKHRVNHEKFVLTQRL